MSRISELREAIEMFQFDFLKVMATIAQHTEGVDPDDRSTWGELANAKVDTIDTALDHLALLESLEDGSAYERAADALDQQLPLGRLVTVAQIVVDKAFKVEP